MNEALERAHRTAAELARRLGVEHHDVLVMLGTGLSGVAEVLGRDCPTTPLDTLPYFPPYTAPGHRPEAWSITHEGKQILLFGGRRHLYEGLSTVEVVHPVRTGIAAGCDTVLLTAAVGSLRPEIVGGDLVVISDHINLTGHSPLDGAEFVDMAGAYDEVLRVAAGSTPGAEVKDEGAVYVQVAGPQFETPAEAAMLRGLGADVVGMSMATETITARHGGAHVLGLAMVTNTSAAPSADLGDIARTAAEAVPRVADVIKHVVSSLL